MINSVEKLLRDRNIAFIPSGRDYLIKCLNESHDDTNPSLRVDKVTGVAHCFSCGWKRNLFKHFGLLTNTTSIRVAKLKQKLEDLKVSITEQPLPKGATPYTQVFRGISIRTLKHFEAFYTHEDETWKDRIVFPIKDMTGRIVAFNGRHVDMDAKPKYLNLPHKTSLPCYPTKLEEPSTSIVIVEGIIDMLNMYDKGSRNTVCVFGIQSLINSANTKLLPYKIQGVTKVFILFDGDEAGYEAAESLKPIIEMQGFIVEIISLEEGMDPGNLSEEYVQSIKEYTK